MNTSKQTSLILAAILMASAQARAEVTVRLGFDSRPAPHRSQYVPNRSHRYFPYYTRYHAPYPYPRPVATPLVVAYVPAAPAPVSPALASWSGNYGADFAHLNEKLSRLRAVVHRQHEKEIFSTETYNRFMTLLEGIEHDEHARAFDRGGNLSNEDFADLHRRLDQANEDIQIALAQ